MRFPLLALAVLAAPTAAAGGTLDTPLLAIHIEDSRGTACGAPGDACVLSVENATRPGDAEVDASQHSSYVGVATKGAQTPFPQDHVVYGDHLVVPANFTALREAHYRAPPSPDPSRAGTIANESGYYAYWHAPWPTEPFGDANWSLYAWEWDSGEQGVHENETGPFNAFVERRDTDARLVDLIMRDNCPATTMPEDCHHAQSSASGTWNATTPRVTYGLSWYRVQVADDPAKLTPTERSPATLALETLQRRGGAAAEPPGAPRASAAPVVEDDASATTPRTPSEAPAPGADPETPGPTLAIAKARPVARGGDLSVVALATGLGVSLLARLAWSAFSTRLERSRLLEETTRRRLYDLVVGHPGIHVAELARRAGVTWGLASYHVERLRKHGYVRPAGKRGWLATTDARPSEGWTPRVSFVERLQADGYGSNPLVTREWVHTTYGDVVSRRLRNRAMRELDERSQRRHAP